MLTQAEIDQRKANAVKWLAERLPHGCTIYSVLVHRTRNKMKGVVAYLAIIDGKIKNISNLVSDALNLKWDERDGVWTGSVYSVVNLLSYAVHGDKDKGRISVTGVHPKATPKRFKAGYTFEHEAL